MPDLPRFPRTSLLLFAAGAASCTGPGAGELQAGVGPLPPAAPVKPQETPTDASSLEVGVARPAVARVPVQSTLPEGWQTCGTDGFERRLGAWRTGPARQIDDADRALLRRALAERDAGALRAVLLLSHVAQGQRDLIEHLEQRVAAASRALDASDVVAAAALTGYAEDDVPARLVALALPGRAHPDLEVRVECARAALITGRTEVIPFLIQVLRTGTRDERLAPPDWPRVETLSWVKSRAAEVLSWRAGVEPEFRPDGSYAHQEQEARRLEALLADAD